MDEKREVFVIRKITHDGKTLDKPIKIGVASELPDGQIAVALDLLPLDDKLFVRAARKE